MDHGTPVHTLTATVDWMAPGVTDSWEATAIDPIAWVHG